MNLLISRLSRQGRLARAGSDLGQRGRRRCEAVHCRGPGYRPLTKERTRTMEQYVELKCELCGKKFLRTLGKANENKSGRFYCSRSCASIAQHMERRARMAAMNTPPEPPNPKEPRRLPHTMVRIRIICKVPVDPEYQPTVGSEHDAEKYGPYKGSRIGYVIQSGGKRINIRWNECIEI